MNQEKRSTTCWYVRPAQLDACSPRASKKKKKIPFVGVVFRMRTFVLQSRGPLKCCVPWCSKVPFSSRTLTLNNKYINECETHWVESGDRARQEEEEWDEWLLKRVAGMDKRGLEWTSGRVDFHLSISFNSIRLLVRQSCANWPLLTDLLVRSGTAFKIKKTFVLTPY